MGRCACGRSGACGKNGTLRLDGCAAVDSGKLWERRGGLEKMTRGKETGVTDAAVISLAGRGPVGSVNYLMTVPETGKLVRMQERRPEAGRQVEGECKDGEDISDAA